MCLEEAMAPQNLFYTDKHEGNFFLDKSKTIAS